MDVLPYGQGQPIKDGVSSSAKTKGVPSGLKSELERWTKKVEKGSSQF